MKRSKLTSLQQTTVISINLRQAPRDDSTRICTCRTSYQPRPQGFSHFLREKPWGRGWRLTSGSVIVATISFPEELFQVRRNMKINKRNAHVFCTSRHSWGKWSTLMFCDGSTYTVICSPIKTTKEIYWCPRPNNISIPIESRQQLILGDPEGQILAGGREKV